MINQNYKDDGFQIRWLLRVIIGFSTQPASSSHPQPQGGQGQRSSCLRDVRVILEYWP